MPREIHNRQEQVIVTVNEDPTRGEPWRDCDGYYCSWPRCSCKEPTVHYPAVEKKKEK